MWLPPILTIRYGEPPASSTLADVIREQFKWKVEVARHQQVVPLV